MYSSLWNDIWLVIFWLKHRYYPSSFAHVLTIIFDGIHLNWDKFNKFERGCRNTNDIITIITNAYKIRVLILVIVVWFCYFYLFDCASNGRIIIAYSSINHIWVNYCVNYQLMHSIVIHKWFIVYAVWLFWIAGYQIHGALGNENGKVFNLIEALFVIMDLNMVHYQHQCHLLVLLNMEKYLILMFNKLKFKCIKN